MKKSEAFESVTSFVTEVEKGILFHFVRANEQIALRDVLASSIPEYSSELSNLRITHIKWKKT